MPDDWRLGCIGVGAMGTALLSGVLNAGLLSPDRVAVSDADGYRARDVAENLSVQALDNQAVARASDVLLIAVGPEHVTGVLRDIAPHGKHGAMIVSVAAGVSLEQLEGVLDRPSPVVRAMPNMPCLAGEGAIAISLGRWANAEHEQRATRLFEAVGSVVTVPERQMDAVTGLSGSGPAYVFTVIQALTDGGVKAGLARDVARTLAVHTVLGSARLLVETGEHPIAMRDRVMSPAGTTAAGVSVLEDRAVPAAFIEAVGAAARRSVELGRLTSQEGQASRERPTHRGTDAGEGADR